MLQAGRVVFTDGRRKDKGEGMSSGKTCGRIMGQDENDVDELCGKPASHHIPEDGEYKYRETDMHLCEGHADEAASSRQKPVRRWGGRPTEE